MPSRIFQEKTAIAAFLIAIGVLIPLFSPVKLVLEPASFALASHAPIFAAVLISPTVAVAVAIGTPLGYYIGGFPTVVVWRAASHVLFALLGSLYLRYRPQILTSFFKTQAFSLVIGIIHAWTEVTVVLLFFMNDGAAGAYYTLTSVLLLVGLGGLAHSLVDFALTLAALKPLMRQKAWRPLFVVSQTPIAAAPKSVELSRP